MAKRPATNPILSWDTFPSPPPEAEHWQPDPDSIAKSGALNDPRFNRDPCAEKRAMALERDIRLFGVPNHLINVITSSSPSSFLSVNGAGIGGWPAPATRVPSPTCCNSTASVAGPPKQITKATPLPTPRPRTPNTPRVTNVKPISPIKVPAWAGPLEKLLLEEAAKPAVQPTIPTQTSIAPHLRKKGNTAHIQSPSTRSLDATIAKTAANEEDAIKDTDLAWKLAPADLGVNGAKQILKRQDHMLRKIKTNNQESTDWRDSVDLQVNHKRYIDVKLVSMLEDELDLSNRATRKELMAMTDDDLQSYLMKVTSAHRHWWVAENRLLKKGKGYETSGRY